MSDIPYLKAQNFLVRYDIHVVRQRRYMNLILKFKRYFYHFPYIPTVIMYFIPLIIFKIIFIQLDVIHNLNPHPTHPPLTKKNRNSAINRRDNRTTGR